MMPDGHTTRNSLEFRRAMLKFIVDYNMDNGYSPTVREIASELGRVVSVVYWHMKKLQSLGVINWTVRKPRSIDVDYCAYRDLICSYKESQVN